MRLLLGLLLVLLAPPLHAGQLALDGDFQQGGLVIGTTTPGAKVTLNGTAVRVSPEGRFLLGFGRDAPAEATLEVTFPESGAEARLLTIAPRDYDIQRIDGLPPKMVTPPEEVLARIRRENARIAEARAVDRPEALFERGFRWPVHGRISGVFGSQRVLNGEPRRPHYGIDIAAPEGTAVVAPSDGVVALAEDDLYYTGGTIILDHGHGLTSALLHMKDVEALPGARVAQGQRIGSVGSTGRSTGPHLDWRVNWFTERLDPALLAGPHAGRLGRHFQESATAFNAPDFRIITLGSHRRVPPAADRSTAARTGFVHNPASSPFISDRVTSWLHHAGGRAVVGIGGSSLRADPGNSKGGDDHGLSTRTGSWPNCRAYHS